jgi:penicillin-binding protein 1A
MGFTPRHEQRRRRRQPNGHAEQPPALDEVRRGAVPDAGNGASSTANHASEGGNGAEDPAQAREHIQARPGSDDGSAEPIHLGQAPAPPTAEPPPPRRRPRLRKLRAALVLLGLALLAFVSWIFGIMMAVAQDLPALENRAQYSQAQNSVVYDSQGEQIATLTNNEGRILLNSDQIASTMKEAVVAVEDARFYDHRGVDYRGIGRAVYQDILARSAQQGASTITQQFVKNALDAQQSRTIFQKLREAALAYHLERQWPKDKILTEYLNSAYFGEGGFGIEAAARTYFGSQPGYEGCGQGGGSTCASQMRPHEAALLAGIIASPSAYSPRANPRVARDRRNLVLQRMAEQGYITAEEFERYSQEPVPAPGEITPPTESSEAPYFTSWLRQQLVDMYGAGRAFAGGLEVHSTLDLELQRQVEKAVADRLGAIEPTAAVVVLDNETSGVLAMVGGSDYEGSPFNLATQGARQPGSAFKPFTLVAALEEGRATSEVFASAEQEIPFKARVPRKNGDGTRVVNDLFPVENYEDNYLGSASIATATTYSDNAVYTQLGMQVGPADVARTAQKLGIRSDLSTDTRYSVNDGKFEPYNPALILGGLETGVTPLEMAHAYETIAEDGRRVSGTMAFSDGGVVGINKVTRQDGDNPNPDGKPVETNGGTSGENEVRTEQVIDPSVAEETRSLLSTVVTSGTGAAAATGEPTWGKTGTTDDNGDAWFCGATEVITACVWVGHADGRVPMSTEFSGGPVDGGTYPALIFADIVNAWKSLAEARGEYEESEAAELEVPAPVEPAPNPAPAPAPVPTPEVPSGDGASAAPASQGAPGEVGGGGGTGDTGGGGNTGGGGENTGGGSSGGSGGDGGAEGPSP